MNAKQMTDKLVEYLAVAVAPKLTDPLKQFKIGLIRGGLGRKRIDAMAEALYADVTREDGSIDVAALKTAILEGFKAAPSIPVSELGIEINAKDAEEFFAAVEAG